MKTKLVRAFCRCGHEGKSKQPDVYQCGFCYYSNRAKSNRTKAAELRARADKLEAEAERFEGTAAAFKAKHSDVGRGLDKVVHYFEEFTHIEVIRGRLRLGTEIRVLCGVTSGQADSRWKFVTCPNCLVRRPKE